MSGFSISVQPVAPASPIRILCEQKRKVDEFYALSHSCARNCDHHIVLIMTGHAHKESCHKVLLILVREQGLYIIKTDYSGKMVVAFTVKEISYLMLSPFFQLVLPLYICVAVLSS